MRYVRTVDGRIIDLDRVVYGRKVIHLKQNTFENCWAGYYWYSDDYGYEIECRDLDIVAQADTIEELCDCLILWKQIILIRHSKAKDDIDEIAIKQGSYAWNKEKYKEAYKNTYGAIWTDKGLTYVAKMNDKGELELL